MRAGASSRLGRCRERQRGQATVELALLLPVVVGLVLVALQVGLVMRDQLLVVHAARDAARAAALARGAAPPPAPAGLDDARLTITTAVEGELVRARASYRSPVVVPLLDGLIGDVTLRATQAMPAEWP